MLSQSEALLPSMVGERSAPGIADYLKKILRAVREFHPDWFLEEIGVERDHVHLHMVIPPKYAVSKVVETLKSVTSRQLKEKFPHLLRKVYWDGGGVWARGFFASTVGINEATIWQYMRHQGEPARAGFFISVDNFNLFPHGLGTL
jgi:putative transposase